MAKVRYIDWNPRSAKIIQMVNHAREIINELREQGFTLTLRQLYYQFVARDLIPNNIRSYKQLGDWLNKARLAGLIDWNAIEDRMRTVRAHYHWDSPEERINSAAAGFTQDLWAGQTNRPEVWIEKDALVGIFEEICGEWDVSLVSCRGYNSQSAMYRAGQRFIRYLKAGQKPAILYFGDHDPSGIQMAQDINSRMLMFTGEPRLVKRVALTTAQVEEHGPPPNPAKETDSRYAKYVEQFGDECWELDALHPKVIVKLARQRIKALCDVPSWKERKATQDANRADMQLVADSWDNVVQRLKDEAERTEEE